MQGRGFLPAGMDEPSQARVQGVLLPGRSPGQYGAVPEGFHSPSSSGSSLLLKLFQCGKE